MRCVVRVSPACLPQVAGTVLGRAQRETDLSDGGRRIAFNCDAPDAVVAWALSFAGEVVVDKPDAWRDEVRRRLARILEEWS